LRDPWVLGPAVVLWALGAAAYWYVPQLWRAAVCSVAQC
jgi:hypothetical protein